MTKAVYNTIGVMSGSSLDGLDIVWALFEVSLEQYSYNIKAAITVPFPSNILLSLKNSRNMSAQELMEWDVSYGIFIGNMVQFFITKNAIVGIDIVVVHGHTVYHYPQLGYTTQIGHGQYIHRILNLPVLTHLRLKDISVGGLGTPIVPIGDALLFAEYKYCLNLGGIMNISIKKSNEIIAFDIGVCNQTLNYLAHQLELPYDHQGQIAASGVLNLDLQAELDHLEYFQLKYPKSLDNSFNTDYILPIIDKYDIPIKDKLRTLVAHIATQISKYIEDDQSLLITGGGAKNDFLIQELQAKNIKIVRPSIELIEFKEALVMGLMGVRYIEKKYNVLKSVTGASENTINGLLFN